MEAYVQDVVFPDFVRGQHEGEAVLDVVEVFLGHLDALQSGLRREDDVLGLASLVVEGHVEHLLVGAVWGVAVEGHDFYILPVGVLIARFLELLFLGGEALDDFLDGDPLGLGFVEGALLGACHLGHHDDGQHNERQQEAKQCEQRWQGERQERWAGRESHKPYSNEKGARRT